MGASPGMKLKLLRVSQMALTQQDFSQRHMFRHHAKCFNVPFMTQDVTLSYSPSNRSASFSTLVHCGNVWLCPECSSKISSVRCDELKTAISVWTADPSHTVYMLTLTHSHTRRDSLKSLLSNQSAALIRFWENGSVKRLMKSIGFVGRVSTFEITYGLLNGWHPHRHILIFCDKQDNLYNFESKLRTHWGSALSTFNLSGNEYSLNVSGASEAGEYVTKLAFEATLSNIKRSPDGSDHYPPFALLALMLDYQERGEDIPDWVVLAYREYAVAIKGKHQFSWSRNLKVILGMADVSDEEIANDEPFDNVDLLRIPYWQFKYIRHDIDLLSSILEVASSGDLVALRLYLDKLGVIYET